VISYEVLSVVYNATHQRIEVIKEITETGGDKHYNMHCFSTHVLEWRSAEYGVTDLNALVEIVLNEPHIEPTRHLNMSLAEARISHTGKAHAAAIALQVTESLPKSARKAQMLNAGIPQAYVDAVDVNPFERIKQLSPITPAGVAAKKAYVDKLRAATIQGLVTPLAANTAPKKNATRTSLRGNKKA
jgi:hypothetical protein